MTTIVLATQNPGKVAELRSMLESSDIQILGLDDLDQTFAEPVEDGDTFIANATIKAIEYAKATGMMCLADDSGLEIDALDGKPGVISSHYAFDGETEGEASTMTRQQRDTRNLERVLSEMDSVAFEDRAARFVCVMVLADPSGNVIASTRGTFEGRIGFPQEHQQSTATTIVPRGENGFGYDPVFLVGPSFDQTSAELDRATKNALSHRGSAVRAMIDQIQTLSLPTR